MPHIKLSILFRSLSFITHGFDNDIHENDVDFPLLITGSRADARPGLKTPETRKRGI